MLISEQSPHTNCLVIAFLISEWHGLCRPFGQLRCSFYNDGVCATSDAVSTHSRLERHFVTHVSDL